MALFDWYASKLIYSSPASTLIKKKTKFSSYIRKFRGDRLQYLTIYEEAVSHIWLCNRFLLNFLIYEETLNFFFYQCTVLYIAAMYILNHIHRWHGLFLRLFTAQHQILLLFEITGRFVKNSMWWEIVDETKGKREDKSDRGEDRQVAIVYSDKQCRWAESLPDRAWKRDIGQADRGVG